MTLRKPAGTTFEGFIEGQIRRAREEGLFDDLEGSGKPLKDLREAYDPLWWAKKLVEREGVSLLPPSLEIRRTVERELPKILALESATAVVAAVGRLNEQIRQANRGNVSGPPSSQAQLDVGHVLERWRERR